MYIIFYGIESINDAEKLKNKIIKIPDEFALPLDKDEYYIRDLYGLNVYDENKKFLGHITDVIQTGANDVYVINKNLLIPAIKECILKIDIKNKIMSVKLLKGLRELND